jgi:rubrerythrin
MALMIQRGKVEKVHAVLYANAAPKRKGRTRPRAHHVCAVCGFTIEERADKCPVCGALKDKFVKF